MIMLGLYYNKSVGFTKLPTTIINQLLDSLHFFKLKKFCLSFTLKILKGLAANLHMSLV